MHEELRLDNQICFRLYTAARLITQAYTPMLTELGITYPQYLVLMVLWEQDSQPVPCFSVWRSLVSWFASVARRTSDSR